jgi:hypothetical protein
MLLNSLAELGMRPCGACRALVTTCPHWKPGIVTGRTRVRTPSQRTRSPLESAVGMAALWQSTEPRRILALAYAAADGIADVGSAHNARQAARRMGVRGLLVQVAARSTRYAITDDGRRTYERILEMDAGRF